MTDYRLYFMSPYSGHIELVHEFAAPDDGEAGTVAEHFLGNQPLELWAEHRKVRHYPAGPGFLGSESYPQVDWSDCKAA